MLRGHILYCTKATIIWSNVSLASICFPRIRIVRLLWSKVRRPPLSPPTIYRNSYGLPRVERTVVSMPTAYLFLPGEALCCSPTWAQLTIGGAKSNWWKVTELTCRYSIIWKPERKEGYDIADYLLKVKPDEAVLQQMTRRNPALKILIDALDLKFVSVRRGIPHPKVSPPKKRGFKL